MKKKKTFLGRFIRFLIVLSIIVGVGGYLLTDYIHGKMNYNGTSKRRRCDQYSVNRK